MKHTQIVDLQAAELNAVSGGFLFIVVPGVYVAATLAAEAAVIIASAYSKAK